MFFGVHVYIVRLRTVIKDVCVQAAQALRNICQQLLLQQLPVELHSMVASAAGHQQLLNPTNELSYPTSDNEPNDFLSDLGKPLICSGQQFVVIGHAS